MIAIFGASHDDILYFENVLQNKNETKILERFPAYLGTLFNQDVIVVSDLTTSLVASLVTNQILNDYAIDLVINVGRCIGVEKKNNTGDIVISTHVIDGDVDLASEHIVTRFELPGFNNKIAVQKDIIEYMEKGIKKRPFVTYHRAVFVSTDNYSLENLTVLDKNGNYLKEDEEKIVFDHNSMGIILSCYLKGVPALAIKVIENKYDKERNIDTYLKVLQRYIDLGKAVAATIGDVGRNDILDKKGY